MPSKKNQSLFYLCRFFCTAFLLSAAILLIATPLQAAGSDINRLMVQAYRYYTGNGTAVNYTRALKLYRQAAKLGDIEAQFIVGGMYYKGQGIDQDGKEAFKWLLRAAEQGRSTDESLYIIGSMYLRGTGVPQNYIEARKWLEQSAKQGNLQARNDLGYMYYNGLGGQQDFNSALELYIAAGLQGDSQAQSNVGLMYATGTGVPRDKVQGYAWYSLAASQGNTTAMMGRNTLLAEMGWDELNRAQAMSVDLFQQVERNRELRAAGKE